LRIGADSTWIEIQKSLFDGTLENSMKDEVTKIQPVKNILFRRVQLLQSGVVVDEGPTLDEIYKMEKSKEVIVEEPESDVLVAAEAGAEISELIEESIMEAPIDEVASVETSEKSETPDYKSMTVAQLKDLLKEASKPISGKKADLISRLEE
jgi:hypothetical protein